MLKQLKLKKKIENQKISKSKKFKILNSDFFLNSKAKSFKIWIQKLSNAEVKKNDSRILKF